MKSLVWFNPGKIPSRAGFELGIFRSRGRHQRGGQRQKMNPSYQAQVHQRQELHEKAKTSAPIPLQKFCTDQDEICCAVGNNILILLCCWNTNWMLTRRSLADPVVLDMRPVSRSICLYSSLLRPSSRKLSYITRHSSTFKLWVCHKKAVSVITYTHNQYFGRAFHVN